MWPWLAFIAFAGILAVHLWWQKRFRRVSEELQDCLQTVTRLQEQERSLAVVTTARQEAVFQSMIEGFLLLDENRRVASLNHSLERMFSIAENIRGKTLMEAFRLHALDELASQVEKEGQARGFELTLATLQKPRYLEVNAASLLGRDRKYQGSIFIFHDVTRLKQLEQMRKEFVANVSHELRTPLTLIKGYVETLIDGAKEDPDLRDKFLATIHKHSNRLAALIEDLLTISQLESGQVTLQKTAVLLSDLVRKVMEELQPAALAKAVSLESAVSCDAKVLADVDRLEQVLYNLMENAIKYGKTGGLVKIGCVPKGSFLQVSVQDNGPGIPPNSVERIFERFYRVDRARSREAGGTGLGLSIVKHIVQTHGGEVWVESQLGQGSIFYFTLPASY